MGWRTAVVLVGVIAAASWNLGAVRAAPTDLVVTDLGSLDGGTSTAVAINDAGTTVGISSVRGPDGSGTYRAIEFSGGRLVDLDPSGTAYGSRALAIDNVGNIVGDVQLSSGFQAARFGGPAPKPLGPSVPSSALGVGAGRVVGYANSGADRFSSQPVRFHGQTVTELGFLPGDWGGEAQAVNDSGVAVGYSKGAGNAHAVKFEAGQVVDLGTAPGFTGSLAEAVNNAGVAAGAVTRPLDFPPFGVSHAAMFRDGKVIDLAPTAGDRSQASGINDAGVVVGFVGAGATHAVVFIGGATIDLNSLLPPGSGWTLEQATDINNRGEIVGGGNHNGRPRGFKLTIDAGSLTGAVQP